LTHFGANQLVLFLAFALDASNNGAKSDSKRFTFGRNFTFNSGKLTVHAFILGDELATIRPCFKECDAIEQIVSPR
jgi:hypothetical protein